MFKAFDVPKFGVFRITTDEYLAAEGWTCKEEIYKIIGETDDLYVHRLQPSGHGQWIDGKVVENSYTLPIGIHKSRFVKWDVLQLDKIEPGSTIVFDLETWNEAGEMYLQESTAIVQSVCKDPLGRHEPKCTVEVGAVGYGIPISEIKMILPSAGRQLELF